MKIKPKNNDRFYVGSSYEILLYTELSDTDNNILRPRPGYYRFYLYAYTKSGLDPEVLKEISYYDFLLEPKPDNKLIILPIIK